MDSYLIAVIILGLIASGALFFRRSKKASVYGPLVLYRTKRGLHFIDRVANFCPRFWKGFSTFGIVMCFLFMAFIFLLLILNTITIFETPDAVAGAGIVIPGITIPFWWGIIALITVLVFHELSHGIIARVEGIKVKSVGLLTLGFIPIGAFTEPDEKKVKKAKLLSQLRIYAAGSFMNVIVAFATVFIVMLLLLPALTTTVQGIYLAEVVDGSAAQEAGLEDGMILTSINGQTITDAAVIGTALENLNPGDPITLETAENSYDVTLGSREDTPYIGINFVHCNDMVNPICTPAKPWVPADALWFSLGLFNWIIILNFGIGLFNLLPLKPFDGAYMIESISKRFTPKITKPLIYGLSLFTLFIVLVNVLGPYLWSLI